MKSYFAVVVALILTLESGLGCTQGNSAKTPRASRRVPTPAAEVEVAQTNDPPVKKGKAARLRDKLEYLPYMRQLGIAYNQIIATTGKGPKTKEELGQAVEGARRIMELLEKGDVIFIYGVNPNQMPNGPSNTILAYEPDPDVHGIHLVLMGDGSVQEMTEVDFAKCPKAK